MLNKRDSVYIAGHTGLIGSAFVSAFESSGYTNIIMPTHQELELTNSPAVDEFFDEQKPDVVILAAGKVGGIQQNVMTPADFINANLSIQLNVFGAAKRIGVKRLVMFGSSCMYPRDCLQPMDETLLMTGHPETTSLPYAISKIAGVQLCHAYNTQYKNRRFIPVIPASVYGPNDNFDVNTGHVIGSLMSKMHNAKKSGSKTLKLWGTGTPLREFIHVSDLVNGVLQLLMENDLKIKFPINIGSGTEYSIAELADAVAQAVGYNGEVEWDTSKQDGAPRKFLNSERLRAIGWAPSIDLKTGLVETYKWFVKYGPGREK